MQTKLCTKCGEQKPHSTFYKFKLSKDGLRPHCKTCWVTLSREWRVKNPDKKYTYPETHKKACEKYKRLNLEKVKEINRKANKKYRESNQEKYNAYNAKYRGAKLQRTPQWLTKDQLDEIETFYTAALAFRIYTGLTYHVDHIVPLQGKKVCGLHVPWNLQVILSTDNLKKSNSFED